MSTTATEIGVSRSTANYEPQHHSEWFNREVSITYIDTGRGHASLSNRHEPKVAQLKGTAELSTMADSKPNKVTEAMEIPSLLSKRLSCGTKETTITINGIIVDLESFQREEESWNNCKQVAYKGIQYTCDICNLTVSRMDKLIRHRNSVHIGVRYPCVQCMFSSTRRDKLFQHVQTVHSGVKHSCAECGKQFSRRDKLQAHHRRTHAAVGLEHRSNVEGFHGFTDDEIILAQKRWPDRLHGFCSREIKQSRCRLEVFKRYPLATLHPMDHSENTVTKRAQGMKGGSSTQHLTHEKSINFIQLKRGGRKWLRLKKGDLVAYMETVRTQSLQLIN